MGDDPRFMTALDEPVDFATHSQSGKLFIIIDDSLPGDRYRVISPDGQVMVIPASTFADSVDRQALSSIRPQLSDVQFQKLGQYLEASSRLVEAEQAAFRTENQEATLTPRRTGPRNKTTSHTVRGGIAVRWSSDRLTFYKHHIEPLKAHQQFALHVNGEGDYVMTKTEFLNDFNSVVMSKSYRESGIFAFDETPEFAKKFLKQN